MNKSSVDVAIIAYNQEYFIKETIESILSQKYDNINKIIIADDGSTDETPRIIKEYASNNSVIEPILAKKNKGIAKNVNRALKNVTAEYVCIIGGDDPMYPQKIEKQVNYLNNNSDLVACAHEVDVFNSVIGEFIGSFSDVFSFKKAGDKIGIESIFHPSLFLNASSVMYKTEKIPKNGFDTRLKYLNDFLFLVEVLVNGNLGYIDEKLGIYRIHDSNVTKNEDAQKFALEDALVAFSIIISRFPELRGLVKKRKEATYIYHILKSIKAGNKKRAITLSKVLMSEGSYIKGIGGYLLSIILNKKIADSLYRNKGLLNNLVRFI